jgi:hypothetical protein
VKRKLSWFNVDRTQLMEFHRFSLFIGSASSTPKVVENLTVIIGGLNFPKPALLKQKIN